MLLQQLVINIKTLLLPNSRNWFHPCKLSPPLRSFVRNYPRAPQNKLQVMKKKKTSTLQPVVRTY